MFFLSLISYFYTIFCCSPYKTIVTINQKISNVAENSQRNNDQNKSPFNWSIKITPENRKKKTKIKRSKTKIKCAFNPKQMNEWKKPNKYLECVWWKEKKRSSEKKFPKIFKTKTQEISSCAPFTNTTCSMNLTKYNKIYGWWRKVLELLRSAAKKKNHNTKN